MPSITNPLDKYPQPAKIFSPQGAILTNDHTRSLRLRSDSPPAGLEDGRAALELTMASYQSAESGQPIQLPLL